MANWTVSLDKPPTVEPPNAVAYVTYASDDNRSIKGVRVPYESEAGLLNFLARECVRLSAIDDRNAQMAFVVASSALTVGPVSLPDISKQRALNAAASDLMQTVSAALVQKGTQLTKEQIAAAAAIDPAVNDKLAALQAAQADAAQPIGP